MARIHPQVRSLDLQRTAGMIAQNYGDKGAIVITFGEQGVRIGTEGLTPQEVRDALCMTIHYSYLFEKGDGGRRG